jgi:hypothetical protein
MNVDVVLGAMDVGYDSIVAEFCESGAPAEEDGTELAEGAEVDDACIGL